MTGKKLVDHDEVKQIVFTGSPEVASEILKETLEHEKKAIQISVVARILKENAVDCLLNKGQIHLSAENLNQNVKQILSSGSTINYRVGDHPKTEICDYI